MITRRRFAARMRRRRAAFELSPFFYNCPSFKSVDESRSFLRQLADDQTFWDLFEEYGKAQESRAKFELAITKRVSGMKPEPRVRKVKREAVGV